MVMLSPLGTPGTYFETGSSRLSLLSCASCMITAAVIGLVFEAILKWVSARGGLVAPSNVVPWVTVNSPWGVRKRTTAPGIRSSWAVVSTMVCSAAWSIGLSADEPAVEAGREHAAIRRATPPTRKLDAFDIAGRTENADRTGAKTRPSLRIIDCLIFLQKDRLNAGRFKDFPAPPMRLDFENCRLTTNEEGLRHGTHFQIAAKSTGKNYHP